ncbi:multidrug transporter [Marinitoga sp. 1135]|uniref:DMT(Drug/metabolite transporter) superfamily permease n=1 Tax=Marinitoga piezophila (strain DSM 14283 / JCM 11233 / KA3) TaxID=443254 RepID=H2J4X6_MARPK|nr:MULTISPECIES: DMT family transporter [Marinitoga]AEX84911.1 DMT(drug/metabolite transporter) superfamily permease [Marinitoga piezophila KA3]APT75418.1 multidrug transporter [Marinitoga sp. 1137]NUU95145.1 multidrug transporter [Marinitoga sp. 1135]NUU97077.1 multidrug transporter [Marinitoga sp. 1138]
MKNKTRGLIYMWITVIFWGISFVATKIIVNTVPPITAAFLRFFLSSLILVLFIKTKIKYEKKEYVYMLLSGFFGVTAYFLFENSALQYTTATNGSLIISATPVIYLLFSDILRKSFSHKIRYFGTLLAFFGVALIVLNGRFVLKLNPLGDLLMFGAAFSWILYTVFIEKLHHHDNLAITRDLNYYGMLFFIPFSLYELKSAGTCPAFELWLDPVVITAFLYLGIFCTALGYIWWNKAIRLAGAKTTTNGIFFIPIVTVIADAVLLKNYPNFYTLIGASLVLAGNYIAEIKD